MHCLRCRSTTPWISADVVVQLHPPLHADALCDGVCQQHLRLRLHGCHVPFERLLLDSGHDVRPFARQLGRGRHRWHPHGMLSYCFTQVRILIPIFLVLFLANRHLRGRAHGHDLAAHHRGPQGRHWRLSDLRESSFEITRVSSRLTQSKHR